MVGSVVFVMLDVVVAVLVMLVLVLVMLVDVWVEVDVVVLVVTVVLVLVWVVTTSLLAPPTTISNLFGNKLPSAFIETNYQES